MIVLMRHAQVAVSKGYCIGRTVVPLSLEGEEQAQQLAVYLRDTGFERLCSSPSGRAMDTIAPLSVAMKMSVDILDDLDEINMGSWDGLSFNEIRALYPDEYVERGKQFDLFRAPGGESFNGVADRALAVLTDLGEGPQPVLAMTHIGVIRAVLCRLSGYPMDNLFHFSPINTECALIKYAQGRLHLIETGVLPNRDRVLRSGFPRIRQQPDSLVSDSDWS